MLPRLTGRLAVWKTPSCTLPTLSYLHPLLSRIILVFNVSFPLCTLFPCFSFAFFFSMISKHDSLRFSLSKHFCSNFVHKVVTDLPHFNMLIDQSSSL